MEQVLPDTKNLSYIHQEIEWQTPLEKNIFLNPEKESAPYPVDALPSIIRNAVSAYHKYGQQPLPLIACGALANVSLAPTSTLFKQV